MDVVPGVPVGGAPCLRVLIASLDGERIAFPLDDVVEVLPAMASIPLPKAPSVIRGLINLRGTPLPLLDLRVRLGHRPRTPDPADHVVVCRIADRSVGIWLDNATAVDTIATSDMVPITEVAESRHVDGVALLGDGMLLVYDVRSFLAADEALSLDVAIADSMGGVMT